MIAEGDRSFTGLLTELTRATTALFRQEVQLAKAELTQKVVQAGSGASEIVVGAVFLVVALQALIAAAILALATVMAWWAAALVVGLVAAVVGAPILLAGLSNLRGRNLAPQRTLETLRDNATWAKEHLR